MSRILTRPKPWQDEPPMHDNVPADLVHYRPHQDPHSSHAIVRSLVLQLCGAGGDKAGGPVLDVGSAQGMLGQSVAGSGITLDAVEPQAEWAQLARPHYRNVYCNSIESAPLPEREYAVVVCADVLEHTADPAAVLARLRRAARPDGLFIISVPNVAHFAVRTMLLFGHFPKMQRGILDRTHLQFFTRKTAIELLNGAGLEPRTVWATGVPVEELLRRPPGGLLYSTVSAVQRAAVWMLPWLFGFQWVILAEPK
jgi:2-polyprenyl-3-methyl-5-hydroxy-6-metoxy-1,4-benzoquinol methylase